MRTPDWHTQIVAWVVNLLTGYRRSQRKTIAELVFGAMRCRRVSLADVGRAMETGTLPKHNIKRAWRLLRNGRVDVVEGMRALTALVARASGGRLVIAVDWVEVGAYHVLRAAVPLRGRGVPIAFAAYHPAALFRSQNALEEGFFVLLKALLPRGVHAVVLADRGFARAQLARHLEGLGLDYIIRVVAQVRFESPAYQGLLSELGLCPGEHRDLGVGLYCEERPVARRVVAFWERGQLELLLLATSLDWATRRLLKTFRLRMSIEELFRDEKNVRYGWGLRQFSVSSPARLERMFLVLVLAYLALLLFGLLCLARYPSSYWAASSSRKRRQTSAFVVGRHMLHLFCPSIPSLLRLLATLLRRPASLNWG